MIKLQYRGSGSWKIASERRNVYANLKVNATVGGIISTYAITGINGSQNGVQYNHKV